jgi:hypothetical protein
MKKCLLLTCLLVNFIAFNQNLGLQWAGKYVNGNIPGFDFSVFEGFNKISTLDNSGNLIVVGNFLGTVDFDLSPSTSYNLTSSGSTRDIFIAKYNSSGTIIWAKRIGDDTQLYESGYSVAVDNNNNIIVAGFFSGNVDFDPSTAGNYNLTSTFDASFLMKLDGTGNFIWAQKIVEQDGQSWDFGLHLSTDNSNNIFLAGDFNGSNDFDNGPGLSTLSTIGLSVDTYILKKDPNGNLIWVKQFSSQSADYRNTPNTVVVDNIGDIYVLGHFDGTVDFDPSVNFQLYSTVQSGSTYIFDAYLVKLNSLGDLLWSKQYGTTIGNEFGVAAVVDNNNNVIVGINFDDVIDVSSNGSQIFTSNGNYDFTFCKLDNTGNFIWGKQIGGSDNDKMYSMASDPVDNIYIGGKYNYTVDFDPNAGIQTLSTTTMNSFLLKLNQNTDFVFVKEYNNTPSNSNLITSLNIDNQSNIFMCGRLYGSVDMDFTNADYTIYAPINNNDLPNGFIAKYCQFTGIPPQITLNQPLGCLTDAVLSSNYTSNNLWSTNGSNQTISVNAAGNYTLTVTDANGCTMKDMITVAVPTDANPPQVFAGLDQLLCLGGSTTLSATGASTYSWSNGLGTSPTPSVSPTASTTYTVTGTSINGCVSTDQVLVSVQNCGACFNPTTTAQIGNNGTLNGTFSATTTTYSINNDAVLSGNTTMSNASFMFASNVKLTVPSGTTLTIQGAHLYACDQMWKGIEVQDGGKVIIAPYIVSGTIQKTSLIEDALTAINILPISQQQQSQVLAVDNVTFNRNQTAISIQGYPFINANTIFTIKNSLITCRSIFNTATPLTWPLTSSVKTLNNNTNLYANPYITTAYSISTLKAPNTGRAVFGIKLNNVGLTTGTSANPVYNELIIGSTYPLEYNLFDHINTGIDVLNSNFTVQNCKFQDPKKTVITGTPSGFATGINALCTNQTKYRSQVNSESAFYNQFRAIKVDYYADCNITGNTFRSIRTIAYSASSPTTTIPGRYGVYLKCSDYNAVTIINNSMYNIEKGVYIGTESVPQFATPTINVNNNTISSNIPAQPISSNSVFDAITVLNVNSIPYNGTVNIQNNNITGVYRGILVQNWSKSFISVFLNNLTLADQANDPVQYGIAFKGNNGGTLKNQIAQNLVNGFTGSTTYTLTSGVLVESSNMNNVECNNTYNTYNGLHFKGTSNYTSTKRNTMQNNKYGFVLDGAAVQLGLQGALNAPCDNIWSGAWSPTNTPNGNFKTLVTNAADAKFSKMYIRSTNLGLASSFNPNNSYLYSNL